MAEQRGAIVTGAASGIGLAAAQALHAAGYRVALNDVNAEAVQAAAAPLDGALAVPTDLAQRSGCRALVDAAQEAFGRVDVVVNNAGFQHINAVEDFSEDMWDKMIAVLLTAPFLLSKYTFPGMKERQWGRIVNIGSVHSHRASPYKIGYISAKHGLLGMTRTLAREGGAFGITANLIAPAYVRTPLVENQITDQARTRGISEEEVIEQVMLAPAAIKRLVEPHEVADMVVYLASDKGGAVSGTSWAVDLGWMAG